MIETLNLIPIDDIAPNPYQPRLKFKPEELKRTFSLNKGKRPHTADNRP